MNKKEKLIQIFFIIVTIIFLVVILIPRKGIVSPINVIINIIALALMGAFVVLSYVWHLKKAESLKEAFEQATSDLEDQYPANVVEKLSSTLSENYEIDSLDNFINEGSGVEGYSFIDEYLGTNIVDDVIKKNLSDNIGGALTGLGILGTFVGLVIGLRDFNIDASTDVKEMQNSIAVLLTGIRTAFLTSIFGVTYSILYNLLYNTIYISAAESVDEFIREFNKNSDVHKSSEFLERIGDNSDVQTNLLKGLSNDIATVFSSQMKEMFDPILQRFEGMIDNIYEQSVSSHNESMKIIVDDFVNQMNSSLGNQFETLSQTIEQINQSTYSSYEKINSAMDKFSESIIAMDNLNSVLNSGMSVMSEYINNLDNISHDIKNLNDQIIERIDHISAQEERQSAVITTIMEILPSLQAEISTLNASFAQFEAASKSYVTVIEGMQSQLSEHMKEQISLSDRTTENITKTAGEVSNSIVEMSNENSKLINEQFANIYANCNELIRSQNAMVTEIVEKMRASVSEITSKIHEGYSRIDSEFETVLNNTFNKFDTEMADISSNLSSTIVTNNETIRELSNFASELPMRITDATDASVNMITDVTAASVKKTADVTADLIKELNDTVAKIGEIHQQVVRYKAMEVNSNEDTTA